MTCRVQSPSVQQGPKKANTNGGFCCFLWCCTVVQLLTDRATGIFKLESQALSTRRTHAAVKESTG